MKRTRYKATLYQVVDTVEEYTNQRREIKMGEIDVREQQITGKLIYASRAVDTGFQLTRAINVPTRFIEGAEVSRVEIEGVNYFPFSTQGNAMSTTLYLREAIK